MAKWRCKNLANCSKADANFQFEIPAGEHEPKCPECGLQLIGVGGRSSRAPILAIATLVLVALIGAAFLLMHRSTPPVTPAAKTDVVVAIDGSVFLNAMLVNTPRWLAANATNLAGKDLLSFGIWSFRPIGSLGNQEIGPKNYTPLLEGIRQFGGLVIGGGPNPDQLPGKVSICYNMFGGLKTVIEQTKWDSATNRNLILITATSGYLKDDPGNISHLDESEIKAVADQNNVTIYSVYVNIPVEAINQDRDTARQQLAVLSGGETAGRFYTVTTDKADSAEVKNVTGYAGDLSATFSRILEQAEGNSTQP